MTDRRLAVTGGLLIALGPMSLSLYTPAMPELVTAFATTPAAVKLTLTAYFAGFALSQLVCGPISDARGRRGPVLAFTLLYLAGSLVCVFAPGIHWLVAGRIVQGVGAAAGIAISRAMVRDCVTGQKSVQVMNLIGLILAIGPAIAPTLGGLTLIVFPWEAVFVFMLLYAGAVLATFFLAVPETLPKARRTPLRLGPLLRTYMRLLRDPRFLRPSIVLGTTNGSLYALATMLPFVLIDRVGLTPAEFGIGMLAQTGSYIAGSLVVRRLLRSVAGHRLVPAGLAAIGLGGSLLAVGLRVAEPSYLTVMGPVGLIAFGIAFTMPSAMTESLAPFPQIAGAAAALTGFLQMGGGFVGSAAAAAIGAPVLALATVIPAMGAVAIVTHVALRGRTTRMEHAVADRIVKRAEAAE